MKLAGDTVVHEAAHCVAGFLLGQITNLEVWRRPGAPTKAAGLVEFEQPRPRRTRQDDLDSLVILLVPNLADAAMGGRTRSETDHREAAALARRLSSSPQRAMALIEEAADRAAEIVGSERFLSLWLGLSQWLMDVGSARWEGEKINKLLLRLGSQLPAGPRGGGASSFLRPSRPTAHLPPPRGSEGDHRDARYPRVVSAQRPRNAWSAIPGKAPAFAPV